MLLNDNEQQRSADSFQCMPIVVSSVWTSKDEISEILANITATLHMNTPEQTITGVETDIFDDGSKQQILIEQLQMQLVQNQIKRIQPRNYLRILNQSNTPASWYKAPNCNRSVYYYDPTYQKYIQQQVHSPPKRNLNARPSHLQRSQDRFTNQSMNSQTNSSFITPRTKYLLDVYSTTVQHRHQQKQRLNQTYLSGSQQRLTTPSRSSFTPTLPRLHTPKGRNEQENNLSNNNAQSLAPFPSESKKRFTEIIMPPTS